MKKIIFLIVLISLIPLSAQKLQPAEILTNVRVLANNLDSGKIGGSLQNNEFALTLYQQVLKRNPDVQELKTAELLLTGVACKAHDECHITKISRSQLLALLLAKKENTSYLSLEILVRNSSLLQNIDWRTVPYWQPTKLKIKQKNLPKQKVGIKAHTDNYQLYYGYLHAHTSYSDGSGTPEEAYKMAKEQAKLDFFSVTDHGELINAWPWTNEWQESKKSAAKYHEDGVFVALHGFEWSSPIFGHINIVHSEDYTNCISKLTIEDIYQWIGKRPQAISRYNHPGYSKFSESEFEQFKLRKYLLKQMVGIEMFNSGQNVSHYFNLKNDQNFNPMDQANQKGWKLGAVGGQDNHGKDWGFKTEYLVGVWAKSLTREGILEGYRERRTFASDDRNLGLSFTMEGAQMGSRVKSGTKQVTISLWDKDREKFSKVCLLKSGMPFKTYEVNKSEPKLGLEVNAQAGEYYYVFAVQEDGDAVISSPIWIQE